MAKNKNISALISEAEPKNSSGSYERLFGDKKMGRLMSKVHSASIRSGYLLEEAIADEANLIPGGNLDSFVDECGEGKHSGVFLCTKQMINASKYKPEGREVNMMVFDLENGRGTCDIIALNSGAVFDTKKSDAEKEALDACREELRSKLPHTVKAHFCAFHADSNEDVNDGTKGRFTDEEVMTGRELCKTLGVDYDNVVAAESASQEQNRMYVIKEVLNMAEDMSSLGN